jgi:type 2A phosphatase activator TIP41
MLYEDELADNGIAMLSIKIRVMPERLLILSRFFLRLDGVVFRLRDTRVFVEFKTGEVIREFVAREETYERVRVALAGGREEATTVMREPQRLVELMPVVEKRLEGLRLS